MCGIAGCSLELIQSDPELYLDAMNNVMLHRGPDDGDIYYDNNMALCHRRLSIIDLSSKGRQPMKSDNGDIVLSYNGEIYNFQLLREDLKQKGYSFKTGTDTEVLLKLYIEYGIDSFKMIRGMYAFAIWNKKDKELILCRDRIGKKPLYYYYDGKSIAFASEIKSILQLPGIQWQIDTSSIIDYLKYLYVPHPKSIYRSVYKLEPGHFLVYKEGKIKTNKYWDVDFSSPLDGAVNNIAGDLLSIISESVKVRMVSDVPLGAFLSGGIDSSAVVALMSAEKQEPVKTCTVGFESADHNEADYARAFSDKFNTEHHEYYVSQKEGIESVIKKLVWHFDEPFADSSMLPTYQVSRIARETVTVAMSGDGGDESFGGYEKYSIDQIENRVRNIAPGFLLNMLCRTFGSFQRGAGRKVYSLSNSARLSPAEGYYLTNTFFSDAILGKVLSEELKKETCGYSPFEFTRKYYESANGSDHLSKILYTDLKSFLPGDILVKVDRMSMANSLEVRSPLLDHKVIEFAARIPSTLKVKGSAKKIVLKKAFEKILPAELMKRKKHGFDVPLNIWFRHDLKDMAFDYLFNKEYMNEYFNLTAVEVMWNKHQENRINCGINLWSLFMFSLWYEECFLKTCRKGHEESWIHPHV